MTFANVGTLGTKPGRRDEVVAILTRRNAQLQEAGCLLYEVGVDDEHPDTGWAPRWGGRILTSFERKATEAGRVPRDLTYRRR